MEKNLWEKFFQNGIKVNRARLVGIHFIEMVLIEIDYRITFFTHHMR